MSLLSKMAERLQEKIAASERSVRCGRIDLVLGDYEMIDKDGAEVLVEYAPELGEPNSQQLGEWVSASFNDTVKLVPASLRIYRDEGAVTLRIQRNVPRVPVQYSRDMVHVGGVRYIDKSKSAWDVIEDDHGQKVLSRVATDDIEKLLQERINRQRSGRYAHAQPKLAIVREAGGLAAPDKGDRVQFLEGGITQFGEIVSVSADKVKVKSGSESLSLDPKQILRIVEKSPAAIKKEDAELQKFWKQIYGPDFPTEKLKRDQ